MAVPSLAPVFAPRRESICAGCDRRLCCYHYRVTITGFDLWRISKTLDVPARQFVMYTKPAEAGGASFLLAPGGDAFELVLAKTAEPRRRGGCLFLVRTRGGAHRCGLGELRPDACARYPAYFQEDGLLRVINNPDGCWRSWSVHELDPGEERRRHEEHERHKEEYRGIVAEWNAKVDRGRRTYRFADYCDYLENRYAARYPAG